MHLKSQHYLLLLVVVQKCEHEASRPDGHAAVLGNVGDRVPTRADNKRRDPERQMTVDPVQQTRWRSFFASNAVDDGALHDLGWHHPLQRNL